MPGPAIGFNQGIITLEYTFIALARNVSITLGIDDTLAVGNPNAIASAVKAAAVASSSISPATRMTSAWRLNAVKYFGINGVGLPIAGADLITVPGSGAAVTSPTPVFTSFVVTKQTAFAGKKYRGRYYMPAFQVGDANVDAGGTIDTGVVAAEQTRQTAFYNLLVAAGFPMVLFHDTTTPGPGNATQVSALVVRSVTGIQRRRRNPGA